MTIPAKVNPGDRLRIGAGFHNVLVDVARDYRDKTDLPADSGRTPTPSIVRVINSLAAPLEVGMAVGFDFASSPEPTRLRNLIAPLISGQYPSASTPDVFGVVIRGAQPASNALAAVNGYVAAQVTIADEAHGFVAVDDGLPWLRSAASGPGIIRWKEDVDDRDPALEGRAWCLVELAPSAPQAQTVLLGTIKTRTAAGPAAASTILYTAELPSGQLTTQQAPLFRPLISQAKLYAAPIGSVCLIGMTGPSLDQPQILNADEHYDAVDCGAGS